MENPKVQKIIETTKQLVSIESTAHNPRGRWQAIDLIATMLADKKGITVERFNSNNVPSLLAYAGGTRPARFDILLNGHIDVVPGKPEQFKPVLKNNRLYGRGVYDMKMATVILTDIFRRQATTSPLAIGLQVVSDEEVGGFDGAKVQVADGVSADFAIFGEMTDLDVCNEMRGICWVEVGFKGISAHGGYAWDGKNAVTHASDFARALIKKFPLPRQKTWTTTANIAAITTDNVTFNRVPDSAVVKIDFRFTPEDPHFKTEQSVRAFIKELDPAAEVISIPVYDHAVMVDPGNPRLADFMAAFKEATGKKAALIKRYASSDTRHLALKDIPCIEFGLSGKNLHADNEYVDLASVAPFRATIEQFLTHTAARKAARARVAYQLV